MSHLSQGTLRRIIDEPDAVPGRYASHLATCNRCQKVSDQYRADRETVGFVLGEGTEGLDLERALAAVMDAVQRGAPVSEDMMTSPAGGRAGGRRAPARRASKPKVKPGLLTYIGRSFVGMGTVILLFLAYQLVGTNFVTSRQQNVLAAQLKTQWVSQVVEAKPDLGQGMALIKIPKIGVDQVVVEGVQVEDLKKGPGHYPGTALPGQIGNMVIAGHRTTYGAPFNRLDELAIGDEIIVYNATGPFKYRVTESKVVLPTAVEVLNPSADARLTLSTCNPKFSARQRLIIVAVLEGTPTGIQGGGSSPQFKVVPGDI